MEKINKDILKEIYKKRPADSKKYDFGLLTIIGGSKFYSGSPALAAMAAFRAGADMVRIIAPKRAADIIASFSPNLAAYPLEGDYLEKEHLPILLQMTEAAKEVSYGKTAVIIGGGMGRSEEIQKIIRQFLSQISIPAIIDADGIHAIAKEPEIISGKPFLVTAHLFEFFILTRKKVENLSLEEKVKIVQDEAKRLRTTILLKGNIDIISNGQEVALNETGTPSMTVGGTGDTLAGIAGALLARGVNCFQGACAASYINGKAGMLATEKFGEGMTATDLIEEIPKVLPKTT